MEKTKLDCLIEGLQLIRQMEPIAAVIGGESGRSLFCGSGLIGRYSYDQKETMRKLGFAVDISGLWHFMV